jgi:C-terminal processing protease CtpA/Prc
MRFSPRPALASCLALAFLLCGNLHAQQPASDDEFMRGVNQKLEDVQRLHDQKQFEKALPILQELDGDRRLERFEVARINVLYSLAGVCSLLARKDEAVAYLGRLVDAGFINYDYITKDADFDNVRQDPRFTRLLEEMKARSDFWAGAALSTPYREDIPEDEKVAGLSKFWSEVRYNFVNRERLQGLNWDGVYLSYLPEVRQTKSTLEYLRLLQRMCALLKDGHTNVYAEAKELGEQVYSAPLIRTRLIEDRVLIVRVYDEQLRKSGLEVGTEVLKVDGIPVREYAKDRVVPYVTAATRQDLDVRTFDYELLRGSDKIPLRLTLRDAEGNVFERTLARLSPEDQTKFFAKNFPPMPLQLKVLEGNVGYVALNSFDDRKLVKEFDDVFPAIEKTDALIIDVRNNGGGSSGIGWDILAYLTDKPFTIQTWRTTEYHPTFRAWGLGAQSYTEPDGGHAPKAGKFYAKPVVVLTSARTYSAAEDFCVAFDYMKRGTIIGEPTGGSTGQPLFFKLPGGLSARVRTKHDTYPDGKEFVDVGVQPGIVVRPTVQGLRSGRDEVLEAALKYLRSGLTN